MAFFDTLKQNLMTASQVTMDKAKNTAEILKLKDQIRLFFYFLSLINWRGYSNFRLLLILLNACPWLLLSFYA